MFSVRGGKMPTDALKYLVISCFTSLNRTVYARPPMGKILAPVRLKVSIIRSRQSAASSETVKHCSS